MANTIQGNSIRITRLDEDGFATGGAVEYALAAPVSFTGFEFDKIDYPEYSYADSANALKVVNFTMNMEISEDGLFRFFKLVYPEFPDRRIWRMVKKRKRRQRHLDYHASRKIRRR